jgi:hypothetical protein
MNQTCLRKGDHLESDMLELGNVSIGCVADEYAFEAFANSSQVTTIPKEKGHYHDH